ncbi:unnamed protein product [marine sediment metagenome]|uniref:Uncharacterized protein n=1 Tax=marine sediment metagenome TaxID=412755 RepID=X1HQR7_9ZZZZ
MHDALSRLWGRLYRKCMGYPSGSLGLQLLGRVAIPVGLAWLWIAKVRWGVKV